LRYRLNRWVLQNFKAEITEKLVEEYINKILISQLKKEGFDFVFFNQEIGNWVETMLYVESAHDFHTQHTKEIYNKLIKSKPEYKVIYNKLVKSSSKYKRSEFRSKEDWKKMRMNVAVHIFCNIQEFYLLKGVFPSTELLDKTLTLLSDLEVGTDGLLFKLNKTGKTKPKNLLSTLFQSRDIFYSYFERAAKEDLPIDIPIVSGNIEIVEVKADKGVFPPKQIKNYRNFIKNGFPLHYFHVSIISFENNQFAVKEKIINTLSDFETIRRHRKYWQFLTPASTIT